MSNKEEFPDDILLGEDAPDPLAQPRRTSPRSGRQRSSVYWMLQRNQSNIRLAAVVGAIAGVIVLGYTVCRPMLAELNKELVTDPPVPSLVTSRTVSPGGTAYAPRFPLGPIQLDVSIKNVGFGQADSTRNDLQAFFADCLLEQGFTIDDQSAYKIQIDYQELPDRPVLVKYIKPDGGKATDELEGTVSHLEIYLSSPDRQAYPWISQFFKGNEPIDVGSVNRFSQRAQRIVRNQSYLATREFLGELNLPRHVAATAGE